MQSMPFLHHQHIATAARIIFRVLLFGSLFILPAKSPAQASQPVPGNSFDNSPADSIVLADTLQPATADTTADKKVSFFKKIGDYFRNANKPKPEKKFDISFIGGPQYSSATQFGIGVMAAGLYRSDRSDLSIQPSNVSLFGNVSTSGFYMLGVRGTHILPKDRYRLDRKSVV